MDKWGLVNFGWYDKLFIKVCGSNGKTYKVETQVLAGCQKARSRVDGSNYKSWLMPEADMLKVAKSVRSK